MSVKTPFANCTRSGQEFTSRSVDYWRLKKKLKSILSSESEAEDDRLSDETPTSRQQDRTRKVNTRHTTRKIRSRLDSDSGSATDEDDYRTPQITSQFRSNGHKSKLSNLVALKKSQDRPTSVRNPWITPRTHMSLTGHRSKQHISMLKKSPLENIDHGLSSLHISESTVTPVATGPSEHRETFAAQKNEVESCGELTESTVGNGLRDFHTPDEITTGRDLASLSVTSQTSSSSVPTSDKENHRYRSNESKHRDMATGLSDVVDLSLSEYDGVYENDFKRPQTSEDGLHSPSCRIEPASGRPLPSSATPAVVTPPRQRVNTLADNRIAVEKRMAVTAPHANFVRTVRRNVEPLSEKTTNVRKTRPKLHLPAAKQIVSSEDESFNELLEKVRERKRGADECNEKQVDSNDSVLPWEIKMNRREVAKRFLASLSIEVPLEKCEDPEARHYREAPFLSIREELTERLYKLFHEIVFQNRFTDPIPVTYGARLTSTGGYTYYTVDKSGKHTTSIQLSDPILDRPCRVRDVLLHEMCHAGVWLIHGVSEQHGPLFRFWGERGYKLLGMVTTRCHYYDSNINFRYRCTGCGFISVYAKQPNVKPRRCFICWSEYEAAAYDETVERIKFNLAIPASLRKDSNFWTFVRRDIKDVRAKTPQLSFEQRMAYLIERWKRMNTDSQALGAKPTLASTYTARRLEL